MVTQFITSDNTDSGDLSEIRRVWVQDGKVIQTPESLNIGKTYVLPLEFALAPTSHRIPLKHCRFNSVSDNFCSTQKNAFGDPNDFAAKGGLKV